MARTDHPHGGFRMSEETTENTTTAEAAATGAAGPTEAATEAEPTESQETDWVAEARKWEKRAKDSAAKLKDAEPRLSKYDELVAANQTELERAQEAANKAAARAQGMLRDVASAKLEAALTGVVPDVAGFIEDINVDKFIKDDGVDSEAIAALRTKYAAFTTDKPGMKPNPSQGRSASPAPGINEQIAQAQEAGDFKTAIRLKSQLALNAEG